MHTHGTLELSVRIDRLYAHLHKQIAVQERMNELLERSLEFQNAQNVRIETLTRHVLEQKQVLEKVSLAIFSLDITEKIEAVKEKTPPELTPPLSSQTQQKKRRVLVDINAISKDDVLFNPDEPLCHNQRIFKRLKPFE